MMYTYNDFLREYFLQSIIKYNTINMFAYENCTNIFWIIYRFLNIFLILLKQITPCSLKREQQKHHFRGSSKALN